MSEFTFLDVEQVLGDKQLEILKKYDTKASITDFSILLGGYVDDYNHTNEGDTDKDRTGWWWTRTDDGDNDARFVDEFGALNWNTVNSRGSGGRPVLPYSFISSLVSNEEIISGIKRVKYGEYPQTIVDESFSRELEDNYEKGINIRKTGKTYTTDSVVYDDIHISFESRKHEEFEFKGKKYVRIIGDYNGEERRLSDGRKVKPDQPYWVLVEPITWLVDEKANIALSKKILFSGVQFKNIRDYKGDFDKTDIKIFMDKYFSKDIIPSMTKEEKLREETSIKKQINPYNFNFSNVSEEDIIKGAIESGVAVFLHGPSSEGKSARVKQIDSTCEIIYLRNATPDSLNGKSVYNSTTGEMIDIKPTWLTKLEEKCEKEKDRLHIVFFDEITNALPSIQGISFNIILDREVNGKWKLPDNARVVAAGNDMKDSLAANKLAEPLFNRFAHVYIKTTTESWLKWASENNIHPAIYSYIAYKNGSTLRSEYNGEKPNADPRKWEMASKMLYQTGNPEMLRCLVGEDITKEFVTFCKSRVITLDDVLNGNYTDNDIESLNTAEKYATVMTLSQVSEDNLEIVRDFTSSLGKEYTSVFDTLWSHNEEDRLEKLQEIKLEGRKGNVKCKIRERN